MGWDKKDKEFGYSRIGLYYIDKKDKPLNFCDIHMYGGETTLLRNVHYGGPSRSAGEAARERTEREIEKWRETDAVSDAYDLAAGGQGLMYHRKGLGVWYCWLFGPVKYLGRSYGSLFVELTGYQPPTWRFVKDKKSDRGGHLEFQFPTARHFRPALIYETDYAQAGVGWRIYNHGPHMAEELQGYRKSARPVPIPDFAKRMMWKLEVGASRQSVHQFMTARG